MSRRKHRRHGSPVNGLGTPGAGVTGSGVIQTELAVSHQVHASGTGHPAPTEGNETTKHILVAPSAPSTMTVHADEPTLGLRLRRAREARDWSREEVAQRLRLPVARIVDIESNRFDSLGAPVYIRSYLLHYARMVDVAEVVVRRQFSEPDAPVVVPRASLEVQPSRRVQRFGNLATYAVLTVLILGPMVYFGRSTTTPVQVRSLETAELAPSQPLPQPVAAPAKTFSESFESEATASATQLPQTGNVADAPAFSAPTNSAGTTVMASMAPMPSARASLGAGEHEVVLRASEDSWMEIVEVGGRRIDQGLLRAGDNRRYVTRVPVRVRIGNSGGVELKADGVPVALAPLAYKNVANLELFGSSETPSTPVESPGSTETP